MLREHRRKQLELRLALGLGKPAPDALVFCRPDGSPMSPDNLSRDWARACKSLGLPQVTFHALRHTHVSALIAAGLDVVTSAGAWGMARPTVRSNTYAHLFTKPTRRRPTRSRRRCERRARGDPWFRWQSGGNSGFVQWRFPYAKCLPRLDGDVAEWLKAAVC